MGLGQQVLEFCEINVHGEAPVRGNLVKKAVNVSPVWTFSIKVSMTSVKDEMISLSTIKWTECSRMVWVEDGVVGLIHDCETG